MQLTPPNGGPRAPANAASSAASSRPVPRPVPPETVHALRRRPLLPGERLIASTARLLGTCGRALEPGVYRPDGVGGRAREHGRAQLRELLPSSARHVDELVDEVRVAADHLEQAVEGGLVQHLGIDQPLQPLDGDFVAARALPDGSAC